MSKEKEIKIEDANANEKVDEQQTEKQAEQAQTDNLSAEDGKEKETEELDPLAKAEQEVESLKKQLLYKTAEFENYRKRTLKEKADLILNGGEKTIAAILPILDDLDLARQHGDLNEGPLKAIADKLSSTLASQKLEGFGEEGDAFDPEIHEAVQDLSSGGEQVVGTVLRRGYRVGDKLVRNAMVIIADPEPSAEQES